MYLPKRTWNKTQLVLSAKWALGQRYPRDKHEDTHPVVDVKYNSCRRAKCRCENHLLQSGEALVYRVDSGLRAE